MRNRIFGFDRVKNGMRVKKWKRGQGTTLLHPLPAPLFAPIFEQSLTLVPHSSLRDRTETFAKQAIHLHTFQHGVYVFGDHSHNTGTYY